MKLTNRRKKYGDRLLDAVPMYRASSSKLYLLNPTKPNVPDEPDPVGTYQQVPFSTTQELEIQKLRLIAAITNATVDKNKVKYIPTDVINYTVPRFREFMSTDATKRTEERPAMPGTAPITTRQGKHKRLNDAAYVYRLLRTHTGTITHSSGAVFWNATIKAQCLQYIKDELTWCTQQAGWDWPNIAWEDNPAGTFMDFGHKSSICLIYNAIYPDVQTDTAFVKAVETFGWNQMYRSCFGIVGYSLIKLFGQETYASIDAEDFTVVSPASKASTTEGTSNNTNAPLFQLHATGVYTKANTPNHTLARQWSNRAMMHVLCYYHWGWHFKLNGFKGDRKKLHKFVTMVKYTTTKGDRYYDFDPNKHQMNTASTGYSSVDVTDAIITTTCNQAIRLAELYMKTAICFAWYGNGQNIEFHRGGAEIGYQYVMGKLMPLLWVSLDLARRGNSALANLSTRQGFTYGGAKLTSLAANEPNKSIDRCIEWMARTCENHPDYRYYFSTTINEDYRINAYDKANTRYYRLDEWTWMHLFWKKLSGQTNDYLQKFCYRDPIFTVDMPSTRSIMGSDEYYRGTFGSVDNSANRFMRMHEELNL